MPSGLRDPEHAALLECVNDAAKELLSKEALTCSLAISEVRSTCGWAALIDGGGNGPRMSGLVLSSSSWSVAGDSSHRTSRRKPQPPALYMTTLPGVVAGGDDACVLSGRHGRSGDRPLHHSHIHFCERPDFPSSISCSPPLCRLPPLPPALEPLLGEPSQPRVHAEPLAWHHGGPSYGRLAASCQVRGQRAASWLSVATAHQLARSERR